MKKEQLYEALGEINENYISDAHQTTKKKTHPVWVKWGAMAACLCLVVVGAVLPMTNNDTPTHSQEELPSVTVTVIDEGPAGMTTPEMVEIVEVNGVEYVVYGNEDKDILENYGLPTELTEDLAGEHVCYLGISDNRFVSAEKADSFEENDIELFEYAPEPNENVYIMCKSGEYFAVIRK